MPLRVWVLLLLIGLLPAGASRGTEEVSQEVDDFAQLDLEELLDVVVTASKREQEIMEAPSAMTVIGREEIQASGARSLPELLRMVPGIDVQLVKPMWYVVGVRGNSSLMSETMLLLVDGRDMTLEFFGFPPWSAQHNSLDDVERIEVIRGPGSALYGANAYAGVVNVITRRPGNKPRVLASVRGAERGMRELNLRGSESFGGHSFSVSAGMTHQDFWTERDQLGLRVERGRLDGVVNLADDLQLSLEAGIFRARGAIYASVGEAYVDRLLDAYGRASLGWRDLKLEVSYEILDIQAGVEMPLIFGDIELARLPPIDALVTKLSTSAQYSVEVLHNHVIIGAEYIFNVYQAEIRVDPHATEHRAGFFLQDELDLGAILKDASDITLPVFVTAGLRFDMNSITYSELSPRASIVYRPVKSHSLRLGYAHAFLKPSFFQTSLDVNIESELGLETMDISNYDLENQTIDTLEFGYHGRFFDNRLQIRLDLAYNWYMNNIWFKSDPSKMRFIEVPGFRIPDVSSGGFGFFNDPGGKKGHNLELQIDAKPTDRLRLFVNSGYRQIFDRQSGAFKTSEPIWTVAAGVDLGILSALTASVRFFFSDRFTQEVADPESFLEPFIVMRVPRIWFLNARIAWDFEAGPVRLTTGLEGFNLLDTHRRAYPGIINPSGADYAGERPGRRIGIFLQGEI